MTDDYKKPYSNSRWNDTSLPEVIGEFEITEQDKQLAAEAIERYKEKLKKKKEGQGK